MGILHIHAAATAHELQNIDLVNEALEWLTETEWSADVTTSYHGPKVAMLSTQIKKKKEIEAFLLKLKPHHKTLLSELDTRLDENNVVHFRLCLESVIGQGIVLAKPQQKIPVIKVRIKLALYPGQEIQSIAQNVFG